MAARLALATVFAALAAGPVQANGPGLHGLALGMTLDQAMAAAHLPCAKPPYSSDIECRDNTDGSNYRAVFSAGDPSIALSVQRSFCSHEAKEEVLRSILDRLGAGADRAHRDPNGYHVDLDGNNEAILNADDGTCPANAGTHYIVVIRGDSLIKDSGTKAVDRAKKALQ